MYRFLVPGGTVSSRRLPLSKGFVLSTGALSGIIGTTNPHRHLFGIKESNPSMTTTAATWFYRDPERIPYYIEERVNQTLWQARVGDILLDATSAEPPYRMTGRWRDQPVEIEWQPNDYFVLRVPVEADPTDLVNGISHVLALKPALRFTDTEDRLVTEWYVDGGASRWDDIQGKAAYRHPQRLAG